MVTDDFFRARLDQMIDLRHPLAVLASRMPWSEIEASLAPVFAHRDRKGRLSEGADMFGPTLAVAGAGISNAGRPRLPIRLMVALLYLKYAYNESDESLVERWAQDVYFQFFSGQVYFAPRLPRDPAQHRTAGPNSSNRQQAAWWTGRQLRADSPALKRVGFASRHFVTARLGAASSAVEGGVPRRCAGRRADAGLAAAGDRPGAEGT
jgi:hypothetical protein